MISQSSILSSNITCTRNNGAPECQNFNLQCINHTDCLIQCRGYESCKATTITCPTDANCIISIEKTKSLEDSIILALQSTSLSISYFGGENTNNEDNAFKSTNVYCPINQNSSSPSCIINNVISDAFDDKDEFGVSTQIDYLYINPYLSQEIS